MALTDWWVCQGILTRGSRDRRAGTDHGSRHRPRVPRNAIRLVEYEYAGQERLLVIEPTDKAGCELVAVPAGTPTRIIHADLLRLQFYDYLR